LLDITINPQEQIKAKKYARIQIILMLANLAIGVVYLSGWLYLGISAKLQGQLTQITRSVWVDVALFGLVFGGIYTLLEFPLSYYSDFVLPHRFDLSNQSIGQWLIDQLKGLIISIPMVILILEFIYLVLRLVPDTWWLWAAIFLLIINILPAFIAPILIFPIFNKFEPLEEEYSELEERLFQIAKKAGVGVKGVYKFDMSLRTKQANAGATGLGGSRRIIIGDTLLTNFTPDEVVTIMAHELGHQSNNDIPTGLILSGVLTFVGFYIADAMLQFGVNFFGINHVSNISSLPLFATVLGILSVLGLPVMNSYSRWREKRADQFALRLTGNGAAFASALRRLANQNLSDINPNPWVEFFLYPHPSMGRRIQMALLSKK